MTFRLTARAQSDLDEIDDYVATAFGDAVAERVIEKLFETFEILSENPGIGRLSPEWTAEDVAERSRTPIVETGARS